jgi:hypothetical protein
MWLLFDKGQFDWLQKQAAVLKYVAVTMETILLWLGAYLVLREQPVVMAIVTWAMFPKED